MIADKKKLILTAKKALWTLNKVIDMTEKDVYCVDIAQQVNATIGLLKSLNSQLLENHLMCCGKNKLVSSDPKERDQFIAELIKVRGPYAVNMMSVTAVLAALKNEKIGILNEALTNPKILATWLYENQGEMRFGS